MKLELGMRTNICPKRIFCRIITASTSTMLSPNICSNSSLLSDVETKLRSFRKNSGGGSSGSSDCTYVKSVVMVVLVVVVVGS